MRKLAKFLFVEIFYNGHFQTLGSLAIIVIAGDFLNIKITWDLIIISYLSFYLIYLHDRYRGIKSDFATNPVRSKHISSFYKYVPFIMIAISFILIIFILIFSNANAAVFIFLMVLFGLLYPIYFKNLTKKIPIFKNFYVASVFTLLVFLPPIYYSNQSFWQNSNLLIAAVSLSLFILIRGLMMQIFLDLKDLESDKKEGLLTLGALWGKEKTIKLLKALIIITPFFMPLLFVVFPHILIKSSMFLIFLIPINYYYLHLIKKGKAMGFILESGEFIPWLILIYIAKLII